MSNILPCPFCGGEEIRFQPGAIRDTEKLWCGHCGACGDYYSDRNLAISNWNRRATGAVPVKELEELEAELYEEAASDDYDADARLARKVIAKRVRALIARHQEGKKGG